MTRLDASRWNLTSGSAVMLPLSIAITACGPVINLDGTTDTEGESESETEDPTNPSGPTEPVDPTVPNNECNSGYHDCDYGYVCVDGVCEPDPYSCLDGGCCYDEGGCCYYDGGCCYYGYGVSGGCCYYDDCCYGDDCYPQWCSYDSDCESNEYCDATFSECIGAQPAPVCETSPITASIPIAAGAPVLSLTFVDVGGDAPRELAIGRTDGAVLVPGGGGEPTLIAGTEGADQHAIASGDLDADGDADLVCSSTSPTTTDVSTFLADGVGGFALGTSLGLVAPTLASADVDGNGTLDLLARVDLGAPTEQLVVLSGVGDGTFAPPHVYDSLALVLSHGVAPRASGGSDIAAFDGSQIAVWRGGEIDGAVDAYLWTGPSAGAIAIGDTNGDGDNDVVHVHPRGGESLLTIWYGVGNGFDRSSPRLLVGEFTSVGIGDITGDGFVEVYVAGVSPDGVPSHALVVDAGGNGSCVTDLGQPTSADGRHAFGDYSGDGRLDLAYADDATVVVNSAG